MLKSWYLPAALTLTALTAIASMPLRGSAQELETCFMVSSTGRPVNLEGLCRPRGKSTSYPLMFNQASSQVFQAPIKRREGGTPVIEVIVNGGQKFEMIVDTGASGTVITDRMARVLGVIPEKRVKFDTASAKGVELAMGRLRSLAVNGAVAHNLLVAIAQPILQVGLLGQDFFGDYDITIKRDMVEFRSR